MSEIPDQFRGRLFSFPREGQLYADNESYQTHLLEQYKLYVEMADRISNRRQSANAYFLSVNTALLGFIGYVTIRDSIDYLWLLGVTGVSICYLWYRLIRSYRDLNTAKYQVIHAIEQRLPISPYDAEWVAMEEGNNPKLYKPVTHIEIAVPWIFVVLHAFVLIRSIPWQSFLNLFR